jgi:hypothetical protein
LILNNAKPGMSNSELHSQLLSAIRLEFSHNISQQIYISDEVWNYIRTAQENLLQLINTCASKCNPSDEATVLAQVIIQVYDASEQTLTELAINKLKQEVRNYF